MNKRGKTFRQLVLIFYLIMAIIVVFSLGIRAKNVVSAEEKADAYSKNIALTINSMFYSDYNPRVEFNIDSFYDIKILENKVVVSFEEKTEEYNYIPDKDFKINFKREKDKLILEKVKK